MGYYATLTFSDCRVEDEQSFWLDANRVLNFESELGRGGSSHDRTWYSWMNQGEHVKAYHARNLAGWFSAWGFATGRMDDDKLYITEYDSKVGQEELMLYIVRHNLRGVLEWRGEDGDEWRNIFDDGNMYYSRTERTWSDPIPHFYALPNREYRHDRSN